LKSDLNNQYGFGKDLYPKSPDLCLSLLNRRSDAPLHQPCQNFQTPPQVKQEEEALVFAQGTSDKKTPSKSKEDGSTSTSTSLSSTTKSREGITNVKCKKCGKFGHISQYCPKKENPPAQIHAMNAVDDSSEASDDESVIILTQVHSDSGEYILT
jgi:hypothetical protein